MTPEEIKAYAKELHYAHPLDSGVDLWPLAPNVFDTEEEKQARIEVIEELKELRDQFSDSYNQDKSHTRYKHPNNRTPVFLLIAMLMNSSQEDIVAYILRDTRGREFHDRDSAMIDDGSFLIKYLQTRDQQLSKNNFSLTYGYSFWHYLVIGGHEKLIATGIRLKLFNPLTERTTNGQTVWNLLVSCGHTKLFFSSLKQGTLKIDDTVDNDGLNAWFNLAASGNLAELFDAIDLGLFDPITMITASGETIIHCLLLDAENNARIPPELIDYCEDNIEMKALLIQVAKEYGLNYNLYMTVHMKQYMSATLKLSQLLKPDKPKIESYESGALVIYQPPSNDTKSLVFRN